MHFRPILAHGGELTIAALILIGIIIASALALAYGKKNLSKEPGRNAHKVFGYLLLTIATIGGIIVLTVFCFFIYIDFFSHPSPPYPFP